VTQPTDQWQRWLTELRHGGDPEYGAEVRRALVYDIQPVADIAAEVAARFDAVQPRAADPMLDFDDRDLVRLAEQAGFGYVRLDLRVTVTSWRPPVPWDRFLHSSPNPKVPPIGDILVRALSPARLAAFTAHLRPLVESGVASTGARWRS
jgi:hypothetical protein